MKKILLGLAAGGTALAMVPLFAAFEAHVINVTATIENALTVPVEAIDFGTVFPQEELDQRFNVSLSNSFLAEPRVDDVEYVIRQKPKCWNGDEQNPVYGRVTENEQGIFACQDQGFSILPLLCPYLSKHEVTTDGTEQENDTGINAFHGDPSNWTLATTLATQVRGRLAKSVQDITDTWNIDFKVPCFVGSCAQDWDAFVLRAQGDMIDKASPQLYKPGADLEHKRFGCDLWLEVFHISLPGICSQSPDVMMVIDRSGSIDSGELAIMKTAAKGFVDALAPSTAGAHVGEVSFATNASLDEHLTDIGQDVKDAIDALISGGSTNLQEALDITQGELDNPGDGHDRADSGSPDFMVLITDGAPTAGGDSAAAAAAAKAKGTTIIVLGVGTDESTRAFLRDVIATSPSHYFDAADFDDLAALLAQLLECDGGV